MKKTNFFAMALVFLFSASLTAGAATPAMPQSNKHADRSVACAQCHKEQIPSKAPPAETCLSCHGGSYEALAKTTEKLDVNPHYTHLGDMQCSECHRNHQPSVNMCSSCHNLKLNVP